MVMISTANGRPNGPVSSALDTLLEQLETSPNMPAPELVRLCSDATSRIVDRDPNWQKAVSHLVEWVKSSGSNFPLALAAESILGHALDRASSKPTAREVVRDITTKLFEAIRSANFSDAIVVEVRSVFGYLPDRPYRAALTGLGKLVSSAPKTTRQLKIEQEVEQPTLPARPEDID